LAPAMSEPTYEELLAIVADLKAQLVAAHPHPHPPTSERAFMPSPHVPPPPGGMPSPGVVPSPPHMTRSTDRTHIDETPRQTTITHTHVEPTEETFPPGVAPHVAPLPGVATRVAIPPAAMPFLRRAVPVPRKGRMTESEIIGAIDGIKAVMVSGVESASYGDKRSEFRSLAELRQILNGLEEELDDLLGRGGRIRQIRITAQWDKGL
jgi:hypothetical protein